MSLPALERPRCWCDETQLSPVGEAYGRCASCGTLVLTRFPDRRHFRVAQDERDFYGKTYWTEHVAKDYGQPTIFERVRLDLPERCVFWLTRVLEHVPPQGRLLEMGCGHGGFVYLAGLAGFEAVGLEMSPWVVEFAKETFGIEMLLGPLEDVDLAAESFAVIAAFDVLEHLEDPLGTMRLCHRLLAPDGVLFLQTPCYRDEGPAWEQFKDLEHTFLFTATSVRELLQRAGFGEIEVRESIFPYDMWVTAGKTALRRRPAGAEASLPAGVRALVDLRNQVLDLTRRLERSEADAAARLAASERAEARLAESDADRAERLAVIERLGAQLAETQDGVASLRGTMGELDARAREAERRDGEARERLAALERDRRYRWLRFLKLLP